MAMTPRNAETRELPSRLLRDTIAAFLMPFVDDGAALFAGDRLPWAYRDKRYGADLVALEAGVNCFHVRNLTRQVIREAAGGRRNLMEFARSLVFVWAARLQCSLGERHLLFYVGGRDEILLRFHLERLGHPNWADLANKDFFRKSKLEVYRASRSGVERLL